MSRIREIWLFDALGNPVTLDGNGRLVTAAQLYDSAGVPVILDGSGRLTTAAQLYDSAGDPLVNEDSRLPVASMLVDPNDVTRKAEFDNLFQALLTVDIAHHEVHEGDSYVSVLSDESAANTHVLQFMFTTPAVTSPQKRVHMVTEHEGSGAHFFKIVEGATYTSGGATYTPVNRNRGSVKTSALVTPRYGTDKTSNKIVYSGGSVIYSDYGGSGKSNGAQNRGTAEWVLAPNTTYVFEIASLATSTQISLQIDWYEHTDE